MFVELLPVQVSKLLLAVQPRHHFDPSVRHGKVLNVGPLVKEIKVDDIVVFGGTVGKWVLSDDFRSLSEKEVLAIEEKEETRQGVLA